MSKASKRAAIAETLQGIGEHETGCHTSGANEIALYVQTTRELHERREAVFADLLAQKKGWKGMSEFNVLLRLDRVGRALFSDAVSSYETEILNRRRPRWNGKRLVFFSGSGTERERQDFILWLAREFEDYEMDSETDIAACAVGG